MVQKGSQGPGDCFMETNVDFSKSIMPCLDMPYADVLKGINKVFCSSFI